MENKPVVDVIILDRNGNKLCAIHCPQAWNSYVPIPLPFAFLYSTKKWTNPQATVRWAWHQVFETKACYLESNVAALSLDAPPTLCVVCGELSVNPVLIKGIFKSGITGVQCENKHCAMYHVTVPWRMFQHTKDIPEEYIPEGFYVNNRNS